MIKDAITGARKMGIGKPEALKENLSGLCSRRIDDVNRLIYAIEREQLVIIACCYHYA
jgi:toxin YoeB